MKCPNCNAELPDDVRFCDNCGAPVGQAETPPVPTAPPSPTFSPAAVPPPVEQPVPPVPPTYTPTTPPTPSQPATVAGEKEKEKIFAIASLVLGVVSLCGALVPICGLPMALAGLILGFLGLKSSQRTLAIAGNGGVRGGPSWRDWPCFYCLPLAA